MWVKNVSRASKPPAEAPMPTTGKVFLPSLAGSSFISTDACSWGSSGEAFSRVSFWCAFSARVSCCLGFLGDVFLSAMACNPL